MSNWLVHFFHMRDSSRNVYILQDGHAAHTQYTYTHTHTHFVMIFLSRLAGEIMTKFDPIWRPSRISNGHRKTVHHSTHLFLDHKHVGATTYMSILLRWGAIEQNTFYMAAILKSEMAATKIIFTHPYFPSPTQLLAYHFLSRSYIALFES